MATVVSPSDGAQTYTIVKVTQADTPYALDRNKCPVLVTNEGATGACVLSLPTDAKGGEVVEALCLAAQDIKIDPGDANRLIGDDGTSYTDITDGSALVGDAIGEAVKLVCIGPDSTGDIEWVATKQTNNDGSDVFNEEVS